MHTEAMVAAVLCVAILALFAGGIGTAHAKTKAIDTDVKFTQIEVDGGSIAKISTNQSLPNNASTPATVELDLPDDLKGNSDSFPMTGAEGPSSPAMRSTTRSPHV